jgi:predicted RNA-binding Zn ribbon-like protein
VEAVDAIDYLSDAEPAPGRLALVQRFVNTLDLEHGREVLSEPSRLGMLLAELGLLESGARVGEAELRRALEVRGALRTLALANNGGAVDAHAADVLERAAARGRLTVRFDGDGGAGLEPAAAGVDGALAELVAIVYTAVADGTWPRLKACRRDVCHWLFYDHSRNRSAVWCRMAVCGNRTKTKAYRARRGARPARTGRP